MILCHCKVVSDRAVHAAVADGADDLDAVGEQCGAGTACGGCRPAVLDEIERAVAARFPLAS